MKFLLIANIVVWAGIFGYMWFLKTEQKEILKRISQIENISKEDR